MERVYTTESAEKTAALGEAFANMIDGGDTIALFGDLGSGKTTFLQGFAKGVGVRTRIISPTFIIVRTHSIRYKGALAFYHIDLYRMKSNDDTHNIGFGEIVNKPENIVAIEWAERAKSLLPENRWEVYFRYVSESTREIQIKKVH